MKTQTEQEEGKLVFADLAGSERAKKAGTTGKKLKEGAKINTQLMCLREAISKLSKKKKKIQWRDSILTQIMKPVLMGHNCLTSVIVCASKREDNRLQTWSTLKFGETANQIQAFASKNKKRAYKEMERLIQKLEEENE